MVGRNILIFLTVIGLIAVAHAQQMPAADGSASVLVKNLFHDGVAVANDKTVSERKRAQKLQSILETYFDIETAQSFALGRYLNILTKAQEKEYQTLFTQYIVALYAPHIKKLAAEAVAKHEEESKTEPLKILREEYRDEKNTIVVSQFLRDGKDPVEVSWRIRKIGNQQKIIDIVLGGGISMLSAIREQIVSKIHGEGVDELLKTLREKVEKMNDLS